MEGYYVSIFRRVNRDCVVNRTWWRRLCRKFKEIVCERFRPDCYYNGGLAVAVAAYAVGSISGAHLNPALTIGLAFKGAFPWSDVPGYIVAQMIGAIIGAVIVYLHYLPHWKETEDPGTKLGVFATGPKNSEHICKPLSEMIGTFVLVFGILAIGANKFADGLNPFIVGFLIVSIGLSLGGTTGYAINPRVI